MDKRWQISPCSLCGTCEAIEVFTAADRLERSEQPFNIVRCTGCGVLRTLPEMSDAELERFYPDDYWGGEPTVEWIRNTQADKICALRECNLEGGRILDVGCGAGYFLSLLDDKRWTRFGIEISLKAAQAAAGIIGEKNVIAGNLLEAPFAEATFDVITCWSSLEHMNDPRANLLKAKRLLKRGGTIIIELPNAASYQAEIFKGDWFALDAPRHRYHFSPQSLKRVLHETGFEVYYESFHSRLHNAHALRQSLKKRLWNKSIAGRFVFLSAIPFIKPFDYLMSSLGKGATLTLAALII